MPEEGINPETLPEVCASAWNWFLRLSGTRQSGMSGPLPISNTEMLAFFELEGCRPEYWEMSAIRRLDAVALESFGEAG